MKVYFGKMENAEQCAQFICEAGNDKYFADMEPGDLAFIRLRNESMPEGELISHTHRLWKLEGIEVKAGGVRVAKFNQLFTFKSIKTTDFPRLDLFKINQKLVVLTSRTVRSVGFIKLDLVNEQEFIRAVANQQTFNEYISDPHHFRNIVLLNSKNEINPDSKDLQVYEDEGEYKVYSTQGHFAEGLVTEMNQERFLKAAQALEDPNTPNKFYASQRKAYKWLKDSNNSEPISLRNFWDLFCSGTNIFDEEMGADIEFEEGKRNYYMVTALPQVFAFNDLKVGEEVDFGYKNEKGNDKKIHRNFVNAKPGDLVLCYDSRPTQKIVAIGEVTKNEPDDCVWIKKIYSLENPISYNDFTKLPSMKNSEFVKITRGTMFRLSKEQLDDILALADEDIEITTNFEKEVKQPVRAGGNKIFYGLPGCGKSYFIENVLLKDVDKKFCFRTVFYQDYSYSDFVGQIMPFLTVNSEGKRELTYIFKPGPFFEALQTAYNNPDKSVYLIIEELNRGNAPSIFGDLFQLLDRVHDDGERYLESEYPIVNNLISENLVGLPEKYDGKICIPSNLVIYATMNTSDQNVFTLDTAFKRRWEFEEISNTFEKHPYRGKFVPSTNLTWERFVNVINNSIVGIQNNVSSSEDKRLGAYFVTKDDLADNNERNDELAKRFANKVLEYIWDDVARFNRDQFFKVEYKTLTDLIKAFVENEDHLSIFADSIYFGDEN